MFEAACFYVGEAWMGGTSRPVGTPELHSWVAMDRRSRARLHSVRLIEIDDDDASPSYGWPLRAPRQG